MTSNNAAIVDDEDPLLQYVGTWNKGGASLEFNSTTAYAVTVGSTASFTFVGPSITVYGTVAAKNLTPQTSMSFVVDGSTTVAGTYTPPSSMTADIHHQALWTSPSGSIDASPHTLVITQTAGPENSDGVIFLDYIIYSTTSTSVSSYFIDDRDPQIKYDPPWRQGGSDADFQHTNQSSTSAGDSLSLQFEGESVSFYGGVTSLTAKASIVLDSGPPTIWVPPTSATQTNNLIFNSGHISPGNHTLVVTAENDQPVWADYILVTPNPPSSSTSSTSTSASSSPPPTTTASPHKSTPIGAIVGPVVGILALVALMTTILLCRRKRRRPQSQLSMSDLFDPTTLTPTPFSDSGVSGAAPPAREYSALAASGDHNPAFAHPDTQFAASDPNLTSSSNVVASSSSPVPAATSNSTVPEDNINQPPAHTGVFPSHKLVREAQRFHVSAPSTSSSSPPNSDDQEAPPHYSP